MGQVAHFDRHEGAATCEACGQRSEYISDLCLSPNYRRVLICAFCLAHGLSRATGWKFDAILARFECQRRAGEYARKEVQKLRLRQKAGGKVGLRATRKERATPDAP